MKDRGAGVSENNLVDRGALILIFLDELRNYALVTTYDPLAKPCPKF
jgi:hypothetical protein